MSQLDKSVIVATIAARLRELRTNRHLHQAEVAAKVRELGINCSESAISKWESGRSSTPSCPELLALAEVYDVSTEYLLGRSTEPSGLPIGAALVDGTLIEKLAACPDGRARRHALDEHGEGPDPVLWFPIPQGARLMSVRAALEQADRARGMG